MNILKKELSIGKIEHEPIEDYHTNEAISSSGLRAFIEDPTVFRAMYLDRSYQQKQSNAFEFGKIVHASTLENARVLCDDNNLRTKSGRESSADLRKNNPEAFFVKPDDFDKIRSINDSVLDCISRSGYYESMNEFREKCSIECTYRVRLKSGLHLQCRPDAIDSTCIWDLKTTNDLTQFERSLYGYGYHIQAGFYHGVLKLIGEAPRDFTFIAVEKTVPFRCGLFTFSADQCELFWKKLVQPAIEQMHDYILKDRRDGRFSEETLLEIPEWLKMKIS